MNKNWKLLLGSTWILQDPRSREVVAQCVQLSRVEDRWQAYIGNTPLAIFTSDSTAKQWLEKAVGI